MSQGGYISALVTNNSRPALSPQAVIPSGYSQVVNAERSVISFTALSNPSFSTETQEQVVYSHFPMCNNNSRIPLPPPASRANKSIPQNSRVLVPSSYAQLQTNTMGGINPAVMYNSSNRFVPHAPEMVSSPFCAGSQNNIGSHVSQACMTNVAVAAQQSYRANNLIAAQQAFSASNTISPQCRGTSWASVPSGGSRVLNAERNSQTKPAVVYNFSSIFARHSREMVTTPSVSNNIIPSQTPVSWVNLGRTPPPTALRPSDLVTRTASNNVGSLFRSSSNPLPSAIQLVHGRSGHSHNTSNSLPYRCTDCGSCFGSPQGLGGHRSWHSKVRRKQEEGRSTGDEFRGMKKFKSNCC
jgi:hypothetical protein